MRFHHTYQGIKDKGQEGFSLPLTLVIGLIMTSSLMGAVYIAMNSNQGTRFDFLRFLGRTGFESLRTQYKALLNDTNAGNIYNYFWIASGCSVNTPANECPSGVARGGLENPSTARWVDPAWRGGRQKAPMCRPNTTDSLDWRSPLLAIRDTFYRNGIELNPGVEPSATGFVYKYQANEPITTATGLQQLISLVGGDDGSVNKAGRETMINLQIARVMSQSGFAFISAGYNGREVEPIALSGLNALGLNGRNNASGTILLRRNVDWPGQCGNQIRDFRLTGGSPIAGNGQFGGLTIFPARFPPAPPRGNATPVIRGTVMFRQGDNGSQPNRLGPGGSFQFDDLHLLPGSLLEINTSQPVTLQVNGDIHIAAGAKICNVNGFGRLCGSGRASQLTIIQGSVAEANAHGEGRMQCDSADRRDFRHTGEAMPRPSAGQPGRSFVVQGTGQNNESLNAFIYAPSSSFSSAGVARARNNAGNFQWLQQHRAGAAITHAVVNKGGFLYVASQARGAGVVFRQLIENGRPIAARDAKVANIEYVAVGQLQPQNLPWEARVRPIFIPQNIVIRHNLTTGRLTTHGLDLNAADALVQNERPIQFRRRQCSWWGCWLLPQTLVPSNQTEREMQQDQVGFDRYYDIQLMRLAGNPDIDGAPRRFKGAVWARNVCFSREPSNARFRRDWLPNNQSHQWEFSGAFVNELVNHYGQEYNFGLPEYRAQNETLVDPQRNLR